MAICRPKAIDDAPAGRGPRRARAMGWPQGRSAAEDGGRETPARGGMLSCLARNGRRPGEESRSGDVAAQAIEAQPSFGQIKPKRGRMARAEQHPWKETWRISNASKRPGPWGEGKNPGAPEGGRSLPNRQPAMRSYSDRDVAVRRIVRGLAAEPARRTASFPAMLVIREPPVTQSVKRRNAPSSVHGRCRQG
jgi:hypothetical protein